MERSAYLVDEKLFNLLLEEKFDKLNVDELQRLFDNSSHEISDKWVFTSEKIEEFFFRHRLSGYKYFYLIDYENSSTYEIGIPDVSKSDDGMDRQKCVIIDEVTQPNRIIGLKKHVFNRLASGMEINNCLINNIRQILIQSFISFFDDEFGKIQSQVRQNDSPTEQKNLFFLTYNVDPKQFQEHKNVVAKKLRILKNIRDMNIKEVFFKPYTNKDIISLISMEIRTMDLVRAINEYMRADASLYLQWRDPVLYNRFDSQILRQYREKEADKDNIKNAEQLILSELKDFDNYWYDNESLILSSKKRFGFRSRQLTDKIYNLLGNFIAFIFKNTPKWFWKKLCKCWNKIRLFVRKHEWARIGIGYIVLSIFAGLFQALFSSSTVKTWFYTLFQRFFVE